MKPVVGNLKDESGIVHRVALISTRYIAPCGRSFDSELYQPDSIALALTCAACDSLTTKPKQNDYKKLRG